MVVRILISKKFGSFCIMKRPPTSLRFQSALAAPILKDNFANSDARKPVAKGHDRISKRSDGLDEVFDILSSKSIAWNSAGPAQFDFRSKLLAHTKKNNKK